MNTKTCTTCKKKQPLSEFYPVKHGENRRRAKCKKCEGAAIKARAAALLLTKRTCEQCEEVKLLSEFPLDNDGPLRHNRLCRPCRKSNINAARRKKRYAPYLMFARPLTETMSIIEKIDSEYVGLGLFSPTVRPATCISRHGNICEHDALCRQRIAARAWPMCYAPDMRDVKALCVGVKYEARSGHEIIPRLQP